MEMRRRRVEMGLGGAVALLGAAAASYAGFVGSTWLRYGHPSAPADDEADALLDVFMPTYDVAERHHVSVGAPAAVTFESLMDMDLEDSPLIRAIFKGRELLLGADANEASRTRGLVAVTKELGWVVLADMPGHEIVMGAVTRPWEPNVVFRGIAARALRGVQRARLREDRVDAAGRRDRPVQLDCAIRNACGCDRRVGAAQVSLVLGALLSGHRADSGDVDAARQERSGAARDGAPAACSASARASATADRPRSSCRPLAATSI